MSSPKVKGSLLEGIYATTPCRANAAVVSDMLSASSKVYPALTCIFFRRMHETGLH